jgi:hypothetical protein
MSGFQSFARYLLLEDARNACNASVARNARNACNASGTCNACNASGASDTGEDNESLTNLVKNPIFDINVMGIIKTFAGDDLIDCFDDTKQDPRVSFIRCGHTSFITRPRHLSLSFMPNWFDQCSTVWGCFAVIEAFCKVPSFARKWWDKDTWPQEIEHFGRLNDASILLFIINLWETEKLTQPFIRIIKNLLQKKKDVAISMIDGLVYYSYYRNTNADLILRMFVDMKPELGDIDVDHWVSCKVIGKVKLRNVIKM